MFVCLCRVVTDGQVKEAIHSGATSIDDVGDACGAGTGCGACHEQIQDMIDREAKPCAKRCGGAGRAADLVAIAATLNSR